MNKILVFAFVLFLAADSFALSQALFSNDGSKATIIIQGPTGDIDAVTLFQALDVPQTEDATSFVKSDSIVLRGTKVFDVTCHISKTIQNFGSCSVTVFKSAYALLFPNANPRSILMSVNDAHDGSKIAKKFKIADAYGQIFQSSDYRSSVKAAMDPDGRVVGFSIQYTEF